MSFKINYCTHDKAPFGREDNWNLKKFNNILLVHKKLGFSDDRGNLARKRGFPVKFYLFTNCRLIERRGF